MPPHWQMRFTEMMDELHAALEYGDPEYTVQRRNDKGRFIEDLLAWYRRGNDHVKLRPNGTAREPADSRRAPTSQNREIKELRSN
jgi:hypothetical protein